MHKAVFSPHERKILKAYLESGTQIHGFRTLKFRINKYGEIITEDHQLMNRLKARFALEALQEKEKK